MQLVEAAFESFYNLQRCVQCRNKRGQWPNGNKGRAIWDPIIYSFLGSLLQFGEFADFLVVNVQKCFRLPQLKFMTH